MATKTVEQLIQKALPGAKVLKRSAIDAATASKADSATPNAAALIRKYGAAPSIVRSRARQDTDATVNFTTGADLEEAVVQFKQTGAAPARLSRRTIVINKKTGKIESTSG